MKKEPGRRSGLRFQQFQEFIKAVQSKDKTVMIGPDYAVMNIDIYNKIAKTIALLSGEKKTIDILKDKFDKLTKSLLESPADLSVKNGCDKWEDKRHHYAIDDSNLGKIWEFIEESLKKIKEDTYEAAAVECEDMAKVASIVTDEELKPMARESERTYLYTASILRSKKKDIK